MNKWAVVFFVCLAVGLVGFFVHSFLTAKEDPMDGYTDGGC